MWINLDSSSKCSHLVFLAPFAEGAFFFVSVYLWLLYQKSGVPRCSDLCLDLKFNSICQSAFLPVPLSFYYCSSVVQFEICSTAMPPVVLLLFKISRLF